MHPSPEHCQFAHPFCKRLWSAGPAGEQAGPDRLLSPTLPGVPCPALPRPGSCFWLVLTEHQKTAAENATLGLQGCALEALRKILFLKQELGLPGEVMVQPSRRRGRGGAGISDPTGHTHSLAGLWPTDRPFLRPGAWAPDVRGPHPSLLTSPSTLLAALPLPTVQPNPTRCEPGCANVVGPLGCRQPGTAPHSIHTSLSIPLTSPLGTSRFFSPPC